MTLTSLDTPETGHLPPPSAISGIAELAHLGVIRVAGEDSVKFLQGQLTQDIALMGPGQARLAAFCNAKGRMQASFIVFRRPIAEGEGDEILMVCSRDILPATLKRLSMFVLRAKTKLSDATADFRLCGLGGDAVRSVAGQLPPPWTNIALDAACLVALPPGAGQPLALWCAPAGTASPTGTGLSAQAWQWLCVRSGIAMITQPIYEAFVPQMLNYESVGGVNFKKGCYPGQEVVARSQFRGTLKRRAYLAHIELAEVGAEVGQEVFHASDAEQPCGMVAAAAANPGGGFDAIVSMQTSAAADAADGRLTLGSPSGPALALLPLPYPLLEDI